MASRYTEEVKGIIADMQEPPEDEKLETFHIYPMDDGILISKHDLEKEVEADKDRHPTKLLFAQKQSFLVFLSILCLFLFLDSVDFYFTNPSAIITITPNHFSVSLNENIGFVQANPGKSQIIGRILSPLTILQSKTVPATGRGHQDASNATGFITFYNGLLSPQSVPEGTVFAGSDGIEVETTKAALIPSAIPPIEGSITVPAIAVIIGSTGNIRAKDINKALSSGILAVNLTSFSGGSDAIDFTYVRKSDIENAGNALVRLVSLSAESALSSQLVSGEKLTPLSCRASVSSNHKAGDESLDVSVTASEICNAISYNTKDLQKIASSAAREYILKFMPDNYSLSSPPKVNVFASSLKSLSVSIAFSTVAKLDEDKIKRLVRGKSAYEARRILSSLPGIEDVSVNSADPLPYDANQISILILNPF